VFFFSWLNFEYTIYYINVQFFLFRCKNIFETRPDRYTKNPANLRLELGEFKKIEKSKIRGDPVRPGQKPGCNPLTFFFTETMSF
jgi:hypothetical protein